jgi:hypothetical protein
MSPFYILYNYYLIIKLYIKDNILKIKALIIYKELREFKKSKKNLRGNNKK